MVNPNPVAKFKKGEKPQGSGRKAGVPNKTTQDLKDAILASAEQLGYIKEVPVLNAAGVPTGRVDLVHTGEGGITGYLVWLGKNNPAAYAPLLGRVLPLQINQRTEQHTKVVYASVEEGASAAHREAHWPRCARKGDDAEVPAA